MNKEQELILDMYRFRLIHYCKKGMGAYYSGGSRPNQTPFSWGLARLASVIMGGNARKVDKKIWDEFKV